MGCLLFLRAAAGAIIKSKFRGGVCLPQGALPERPGRSRVRLTSIALVAFMVN